jgi:glutamate 5-kinase
MPLNKKYRFLYVTKARKIILKVGTKVLLSHHQGINTDRIDKLVDHIAAFREKGYQFSIVTSGAVGLGMNILNIETRPTDLKKIQALASIGQSLLMDKWNEIFERRGLHVGQILLTYDIFQNRKRFLHARDCLGAMAEYGTIPVINENDSVAVDELKFGDNDMLSALAANLIDADLLVLYTDTDGVFTKNPKKYPDAVRVPLIQEVNDDIFKMIEDKQNAFSLGGMTSKLKAACLAVKGGTGVVITDGMNPRLKELLQGNDIGTFIKPDGKYIKERKKWIFFNQKIKGKIFVDNGAEDALIHNLRSLLPGGILKTEMEFDEGAIVGIFNTFGEMIGMGITHYSSEDIEKIKGQKTNEIKREADKRFYEEVIHRDNMIIL